MNPYRQLIDEISRLMQEGRELPLGEFSPLPRPSIPSNAPRVLIFSPHPDDECIIGGLPLRLFREARMQVINVAVTLGSNTARRPERLNELRAACEFIGFELLPTRENGLEKIKPHTRTHHPEIWRPAVERIAEILNDQQPALIFFPHPTDRNTTHIGTNQLILDALTDLGGSIQCHTVETEFWEPMPQPNLLVESSTEDVTDLVTALSFHVGEVRRNPYHLRMPAWMLDNVRRGAEHVGTQGGGMPDYLFGTLYRLQKWNGEALIPSLSEGRFLGQNDPIDRLLS